MRHGGRGKGTPNKKTQSLIEKAEQVGVDPFEILLRFAKGDWEGLGYPSATVTKVGKGGEAYEVDVITSDQRLKAASEAATYMHPKRKAIEGSLDLNHTADDRPLKDLTDEELEELATS